MKICFENEFMYVDVISKSESASCGFYLGARVFQWSRIQKPFISKWVICKVQRNRGIVAFNFSLRNLTQVTSTMKPGQGSMFGFSSVKRITLREGLY